MKKLLTLLLIFPQILLSQITLDYSKYFGSVDMNETHSSVVKDSYGFYYIAGHTFQSTNFDYFISKFDANGNQIWTNNYGTAGDDKNPVIRINNQNEIILVGSSNNDVMIMRINMSGILLDSLSYPTTDNEQVIDFAFDGSGDIVVAGNDVSLSDGFVMKFNGSNFIYKWTSYVTGTGWEDTHKMIIDGNNDIYVTGKTFGGQLAVTQNCFQSIAIPLSTYNVFLAKFDVEGTLIYSTYISGNNKQDAFGLFIDNNTLYMSGYTDSNDFPMTSQSISAPNAFVIKIDANNGYPFSGTLFGGVTGYDEATKLVVYNNEIYILGQTGAIDFPVSNNAIRPNLVDNVDLFFVKMDINFNILYATYLGGSSPDVPSEIMIDSNYIYISASTYSNDVDLAINSYYGNEDVVVLKLNSNITTTVNEIITQNLYGDGKVRIYNEMGQLLYVGDKNELHQRLQVNTIYLIEENKKVTKYIKLN